MTPDQRLRVLAIVILLSAIYAVLVQQAPKLASALAIGYLIVVVTAFGLVQMWRKP